METRPLPLTNTQQSSRVSFLKASRLDEVGCSVLTSKCKDIYWQRTGVERAEKFRRHEWLNLLCLARSWPWRQCAACQLTAVSPHSFTAAVDRGWTMMARMCGEQLRIIQATSPVHMCMNFYRHSSIKPVFFQSIANERFAPPEHHPGRSEWKTQQLPKLCPSGLYGTSGPLNISLQLGLPLSPGWSFGQTCLSKVLCEGVALSPSLQDPIHTAGI